MLRVPAGSSWFPLRVEGTAVWDEDEEAETLGV